MFYMINFFPSFILLILLAYKWELEWKVVIPWSFLMGILACLTIFFIGEWLPNLQIAIQMVIGISQSVLFSGIAILILFFRDPERVPPAANGIIVSPADGKIKYVKTIQGSEFPFAVKGKRSIPMKEFTEREILEEGGVQIGIGLSLLDIHVNRSPVGGKVSYLKMIPGRFKSLKKIGSLLENERAVTIIEGHDMPVGLVLIASRLVRRISFYLKENEYTYIGQRLGMIRFGSQTDVLIPNRDTLQIHAKTGMKVKAGITVLATY